jgi:hypothetical protein
MLKDRDATYLLVMHRAGPEVRRAYKQLWTITGSRSEPQTIVDATEHNLDAYYQACAEHLEKVWPTNERIGL